MRRNDLIKDIQEKFPELPKHRELALDIVQAIQDAEEHGAGTFWWDGVPYKIEARWVDGCISGDCNPATCWTDYSIFID